MERSAIGVELGHCAEWKRPLIVDVADRDAGERGDSRKVGRFAEHIIEVARACVARLGAFRKLPVRDTGDAGERAAQGELAEHAIDPVGRLADVFENEDGISVVRREARAAQRGEQREVATGEPALGAAGSKRARRGRIARRIAMSYHGALERIA